MPSRAELGLKRAGGSRSGRAGGVRGASAAPPRSTSAGAAPARLGSVLPGPARLGSGVSRRWASCWGCGAASRGEGFAVCRVSVLAVGSGGVAWPSSGWRDPVKVTRARGGTGRALLPGGRSVRRAQRCPARSRPVLGARWAALSCPKAPRGCDSPLPSLCAAFPGRDHQLCGVMRDAVI